MKIRYTLLYLVVACSVFTLSAQHKYTLEECIEIALENNRNIKQQELNKHQKEIAYSQARADLLQIGRAHV